MKTELDCNEASRSVLLLVTFLPHLDYSREVYLFQLRELVSKQAGDQKSFADEMTKGLDGDEFVVF